MDTPANPSDNEKSPGGIPLRPYAPRTEPARLGFSDAPREWAEIREKYYENYFGKCTLVWHEMLPFVPHVDVLIFPPSQAHERDFVTLATSGMSDERMFLGESVPPDLARAELILYLPSVQMEPYQTAKPWFIEMLHYLAHFPFEYKTWLGQHQTLQNGTPPEPFAPGSQMNTALMLPPVFEPKEFATGLRLGAEPVNFLWVSLLTDDELAFKLQNGTAAFYDILAKVQYPQVLDVSRSSIIK